VHMAKIRNMGERCLAEAEQGLARVNRHREEAEQAVKFMKGYQLLSAYYEKKVAAATLGLIYSHSHLEADKQQAERLADQALASFEPVVKFIHEELDPVMTKMYGVPMQEMLGAYLGQALGNMPALLESEKKERVQFAELFFEGKNRYSNNFIG
jgi:hypothetical protein